MDANARVCGNTGGSSYEAVMRTVESKLKLQHLIKFL